MKYFDGFIAENDGYGIVGYSFVCPYCEKFNRFVDEDDYEQVCEECGKTSKHCCLEPEDVLDTFPKAKTRTEMIAEDNFEVLEEGEEW